MSGGRTTWRLFHAGDARVRAGPFWNLFLMGQSIGELFQTETPRFFQHTQAGRLLPFNLQESPERWALNLMVVRPARKAELPASFSNRTSLGSSPPLTDRLTSAQAYYLPPAPKQDQLSSRENAAGRSSLLWFYPPAPCPLSPIPPKPVAVLRSSLSGCLRRRRLEEPLWGALHEANDFFPWTGPREHRRRRCCRSTGYLK